MKNKKTIGIMAPIFGTDHVEETISHIIKRASEYGYNIVIVKSNKEKTNQSFAFDYADGWINFYNKLSVDLYERIIAENKPIVAYGFDEGGKAKLLHFDNRGAMFSMVSHLIGHGHRDIAFIANLTSVSMKERLEGYKEALAQNGIEYNENYVFNTKKGTNLYVKEVMKRIINLNLPITAIAAGADFVAVSVMDVLLKEGYRIPEDYAISGFDDNILSRSAEPMVSTISQDNQKLAYRSVDIIAKALGDHCLDEDFESPAGFQMRLRESCGCKNKLEETIKSRINMSQKEMESYIQQVDLHFQQAFQIDISSQNNSQIHFDEFPLFLLPAVNEACVGKCLPKSAGNKDITVNLFYKKKSGWEKKHAEAFSYGRFPPASWINKGDASQNPTITFIICISTLTNEGMFFASSIDNNPEISASEYRSFCSNLDLVSLTWEKNVLTNELVIQNREYHSLAYHDYLTGLPNRIALYEMMESCTINNADSFFSIILIDLDGFKRINDSYGHYTGDTLLIHIAKNIMLLLDEEMQLYRYGGDEFIVFVKNKKEEDLASLCEEIQSSVSNSNINLYKSMKITCSIGISTYPSDANDIDLLLKYADMALYHAKRRGKNHFVFFFNTLVENEIRQLKIEERLFSSILNNEFTLFYQPQYHLKTGKIIGVEALLRWTFDDMRIGPSEFIPIAEENGFIVQIGSWVIKEACKQKLLWNQMGYRDMVISVNVSYRQLRHLEFVSFLKNTIKKAGIRPNELCLEITESLVAEDLNRAIEIIREIAGLGVLISLDDFGVGYSSLSILHQLPLNSVKIDRSFIADITEDSSTLNVLKSISIISEHLELKTIVEGIETEEQLGIINPLGFDAVQGFLFSKPVPADEVVKLFGI